MSVPIERRRDLLHIMFAAPKDSLRLSPLFHAPSRQVLERCDIDFNRETIHLRVTKNSESRYVPMTGEMRQLLERMKAQREKAVPENRALLVKEAQGFITSACQKLGIPRLTTHALRHLFGTACLEAGLDVRTVAGWLGHRDNGALLLKVYSHVRIKRI